MQLLRDDDERRNPFVIQLERHLERVKELEAGKRVLERTVEDEIVVDVTFNEIARCKNVVEVCTIGIELLMEN